MLHVALLHGSGCTLQCCMWRNGSCCRRHRWRRSRPSYATCTTCTCSCATKARRLRCRHATTQPYKMQPAAQDATSGARCNQQSKMQPAEQDATSNARCNQQCKMQPAMQDATVRPPKAAVRTRSAHLRRTVSNANLRCYSRSAVPRRRDFRCAHVARDAPRHVCTRGRSCTTPRLRSRRSTTTRRPVGCSGLRR